MMRGAIVSVTSPSYLESALSCGILLENCSTMPGILVPFL